MTLKQVLGLGLVLACLTGCDNKNHFWGPERLSGKV